MTSLPPTPPRQDGEPGDGQGGELGGEPGGEPTGEHGGQQSGRSTPEPGDGAAHARGEQLAHGARVAAVGVAGAARVSGRVGGRMGRFAVASARRAANAQGADRSGLNRLIYLCAANSAGDAAVAISLASTVFFSGATSDARGQTALFLGLTMVPFMIVAPLIGPFLDRFAYGRRWAMGTTMGARAILCLVLANAVESQSFSLYWAALGVLVGSKAFDVTRAAAVPRLLPDGFTLVRANGRVSMAGVVAVVVSAPIAGLTIAVGSRWCLYYAMVVFVLGTVAAVQMPERVDSTAGEESMHLRPPSADGRRRGTHIPAHVAHALRANCGPRFLSGFLTMFLAFLLRDHRPDSWHHSEQLLVAVVIGSVGAGTTAGIVTSSVLKRANPGILVALSLLADVGALLFAAVWYGPVSLVVLGFTAGLMQQLAKVALDSSIQSSVPERVQSSAFARSNATLQMVWVVGGFVGIALPLWAHFGLSVALAVLVAWTVFVLLGRPTTPPTELRSGPDAADAERAEARGQGLSA